VEISAKRNHGNILRKHEQLQAVQQEREDHPQAPEAAVASHRPAKSPLTWVRRPQLPKAKVPALELVAKAVERRQEELA
jgi:hypothetical protein